MTKEGRISPRVILDEYEDQLNKFIESGFDEKEASMRVKKFQKEKYSKL